MTMMLRFGPNAHSCERHRTYIVSTVDHNHFISANVPRRSVVLQVGNEHHGYYRTTSYTTRTGFQSNPGEEIERPENPHPQRSKKQE